MLRRDHPDDLGLNLARSLKRRFGVEVKQVAALIEADEDEVLGIFTGARQIRSEIALRLETVFGLNATRLVAMQAELALSEAAARPDVKWTLDRLRRLPDRA